MIDYGFGIKLRPVERGHIEIMRKWRNDPSIWRWSRQNDLISDAMQERWFDHQDQDPSIHMYMIQTEEIKGVCGLTSHDRNNRTAELSIYIAPEFQRQGLSTGAFLTLLMHGFKNLGLHSVWCECLSGNPVIKVVKRVGFQPDGIKRAAYFKEGRFVDAEIFSILEDECPALPSSLLA